MPARAARKLGKARTIFISHCSRELRAAEKVKDALETAGFQCFLAPGSMTPGKNWAGQLHDALGGAHAMVVICSRLAVESDWVLLEIGAAWMRKITIIPFLIELDVQLPDLVRTFQVVDADPGRFDQGLKVLCSKLSGKD